MNSADTHVFSFSFSFLLFLLARRILSTNQLSGDIPSSIGNLASLSYLCVCALASSLGVSAR
jgi:hypothetical protein